MNIIKTAIPGLLIIEPQVFGDSRGFFMESWQQQRFDVAVGEHVCFVQDNHSRSQRGVLRGLHFQRQHTQGKLVRVSQGCVYDVAVDLRANSDTYGQHMAVELSADNHLQFWIPPGFAHGFLVISESADFQYKTTDIYHPDSEEVLAWDDPEVDIQWPITRNEILISSKDSSGKSMKNISPIKLD